MKNQLDMSLDEKLLAILSLSWLPFVGKNYLKSDQKILIVGESHYVPEDDDEEFYARKEWTREYILKEGLELEPWYMGTAKNALTREIEKTISGGLDKETWNNVAFFNLIQRLLSSINKVDRPTYNDIIDGLKAFKEVVPILDPDMIIFCGVEAGKHFEQIHHDPDFKIEEIDLPKVKINGAYPRQYDLTFNNKTRRCTFVKHPSMGYSVEEWRPIIFGGNN